jgi:hypothetical protein
MLLTTHFPGYHWRGGGGARAGGRGGGRMRFGAAGVGALHWAPRPHATRSAAPAPPRHPLLRWSHLGIVAGGIVCGVPAVSGIRYQGWIQGGERADGERTRSLSVSPGKLIHHGAARPLLWAGPPPNPRSSPPKISPIGQAGVVAATVRHCAPRPSYPLHPPLPQTRTSRADRGCTRHKASSSRRSRPRGAAGGSRRRPRSRQSSSRRRRPAGRGGGRRGGGEPEWAGRWRG